MMPGTICSIGSFAMGRSPSMASCGASSHLPSLPCETAASVTMSPALKVVLWTARRKRHDTKCEQVKSPSAKRTIKVT